MRVLGKMRIVCKQWNYMLSFRDALQRIVPNWLLHSTPGFFIEIHQDWNDVEYWAIEGCVSDIYKVPYTVLGKMRNVCKKWSYLMSSRDELQEIVPN